MKQNQKKKKKKKPHKNTTGPNSPNKKILLNTYIYIYTLPWFVTDTSIKLLNKY